MTELTDFAAMVATTDHVYVTGGPGTTSVAVLHVDGTQDASLTGVAGATGIAVDQDILYVASADAGRIDRFDLSTDPPTPLSAFDVSSVGDPLGIVVSAGTIWFGTCEQDDLIGALHYTGVLGSLPTDDGTPVISYTDDGWDSCPAMHWDPAVPNRLLLNSAGDTRDGGGSGWPNSPVYSYDVSGGTLVLLAGPAIGNDDNAPIAAVPGSDALAMGRHYSDVAVYSASDLSPTDETYAGMGETALTTSESTGMLAGSGYQGQGIWVWSAGRQRAIAAYDVGGTTPVRRHGLLFAPDGASLFAVLGIKGTPIEFRVLHPTKTPSEVAVTARPTRITYGERTTVTVRLKGAGAATTVRLFADPVDGPEVAVGTKAAGDDGLATFTVAPRVKTSYRAAWLGLDPWTEVVSDWERVGVRHEVTGRMIRADSVLGSVAVYRTNQRVFFTVQVRPPHPGKAVNLLFQRRVGSTWTFGGENSFRQSGAGRLTVFFERGWLPKGTYRIHADFREDREHLADISLWALFKII